MPRYEMVGKKEDRIIVHAINNSDILSWYNGERRNFSMYDRHSSPMSDLSKFSVSRHELNIDELREAYKADYRRRIKSPLTRTTPIDLNLYQERRNENFLNYSDAFFPYEKRTLTLATIDEKGILVVVDNKIFLIKAIDFFERTSRYLKHRPIGISALPTYICYGTGMFVELGSIYDLDTKSPYYLSENFFTIIDIQNNLTKKQYDMLRASVLADKLTEGVNNETTENPTL